MPGALKKVLAERFAEIRESEKSGVQKEFEKHKESGKYRGYVLLENYIIHRQLLERINLELEKPGAAETYADAVRVFEDFGLDSSLYYPCSSTLGIESSGQG